MAQPPRALPLLDKDSEAFWTGGKNGELLIYRCAKCRYYVHPPVEFCPECESRQVGPEPVSGKATVGAYSINYRAWMPGLDTPYVVALVEIAEQDDVRLACNIVNCPVDDVYIGMPVKVLFEQAEELWVPLFEPDNAAGEALA